MSAKAAAALDDAGYAVEEVEPPSIDAGGEDLPGHASSPPIRAMWHAMSRPCSAPDTSRFVSALLDVAGEPDPVTTVPRAS